VLLSKGSVIGDQTVSVPVTARYTHSSATRSSPATTIVRSHAGRSAARAIACEPRRSDEPPGPHQALSRPTRAPAPTEPATSGCQSSPFDAASPTATTPPVNIAMNNGRIRQGSVIRTAVARCTGLASVATNPSDRPRPPRV
jgi:hypothetical protein